MFSAEQGGALARWLAAVLRDDETSTIVCPGADNSWGFPSRRVIVLPRLRAFMRWSRLFRSSSATPIRYLYLRSVFSGFARKLKAGDIVWIHNRPDFAVVFGRMIRGRGIQLALHLHNSHLNDYPEKFSRLIDLDLLVGCSNFIVQEAKSKPARYKQSIDIPNGADPDLFYPREASPHSPPNPLPDAPVILFVGRLVPEKGVHIFAQALKLLQDRGVAVKGRAFGAISWGDKSSSPYLDQLRRDSPTNVEYLPPKIGIALADEYRAATVFCCPSLWNEPFGMVNVEAMATAIPVVATRVGGIPEIFAEGGALLVEPDSAEALANALEGLLQNPDARREIGAQGYRVFLKKYRWSSVREHYEAAIAQLQSKS